MGKRENEPLRMKPMHLFVQAAESMEEPLKKITALFLTFTGVRNGTFGHLHRSWFTRDEGKLYVEIPEQDPVEGEGTCRKAESGERCGWCRKQDKWRFSPKSLAAEDRTLLITEDWYNHYKEERQEHSLRDSVEDYFQIDDDGVGHDMIGKNGLSIGTVNTYVKEVAAESESLGLHRKTGYTNYKRLGKVPDVDAHDLRGTFCTQLLRNGLNRDIAITRTGHAYTENLAPYAEVEKEEYQGDPLADYI